MHWNYQPILKWKQGERIALRQLTSAQWAGVLPLIELRPLPKKPEGAPVSERLREMLGKVATEMKGDLPEDQPLAVDVRWIEPGYASQTRLLAATVKYLRKHAERTIVPVITEGMSARVSDLKDLLPGPVLLRLKCRTMSAEQVRTALKLVADGGFKKIHVVLDVDSLVNDDPSSVAAAVTPLVAAVSGAASVTFAGGSFPTDLVGFKKGAEDLPRVEWLAWRALRAPLGTLRFGDYAVTNPGPLREDIDPTQMNPSVAIRYAADDSWRLFKAGGFKKGAPDQYRKLCKLLLMDTVYCGADFSDGDMRYELAAQGKLGNGNPSSWRRDATSHHLVLTATQVRGAGAASGAA